ncbi:MAG TPA: serine/threonine-protein kinase, partial [Myxococcota bacterium]
MTSDASLDASLGDASATLPAKARIDVSSIGRFDIDAEIGKGGMAVVYAATDRESGERVALKVMTSADAQATERFHREVKAASQLVHPGICRVIAYGVDVHDGGASRPFLAMEYVDGGTLFALSKKAPVVPGVIAAEILRQLLEALACAHAAGVVHRDLKPQNVMITPAGSVKLLDFGIAKSVDDETLTQTGMLVGTPAFMSPEQARSLPLDGRSDLFSAAMTIASVLRKSPHRFSNGARMDPTQILMRVAYEPHGPVFEKAAHCPVALDFALAPMTTLMPEARVPSASAALIVLRESGVLPKEGPALLAQFVHKTAAESERLCAAQRAQEIAFADAVSKKAGGEVAAALALHRAWHLTPDDDTAARSRAFNQQHKLSFDETDDARIVDLLKSYDENPSHAGVLKALADRYKALGRVRHAAIYLWRYAAERPDDASATQQLSVMLEGPSDPNRATTDIGKRLSTKSIMSGVKSGGLKKPLAPGLVAAAGTPTRHMQRPGVGTATR